MVIKIRFRAAKGYGLECRRKTILLLRYFQCVYCMYYNIRNIVHPTSMTTVHNTSTRWGIGSNIFYRLRPWGTYRAARTRDAQRCVYSYLSIYIYIPKMAKLYCFFITKRCRSGSDVSHKRFSP